MTTFNYAKYNSEGNIQDSSDAYANAGFVISFYHVITGQSLKFKAYITNFNERFEKMNALTAEDSRNIKALRKFAPDMFSPDTGEFKPLPMYMGLKSSDPYGLIYDLEGDLSQTKPITKPMTGNDINKLYSYFLLDKNFFN